MTSKAYNLNWLPWIYANNIMVPTSHSNTSGNMFQRQIISADNRWFPYQFYLPRSMRRPCCFLHVWPMPKLGFPSSWCIILNAFHLVKEWQNLGSRTCCEKKAKRLRWRHWKPNCKLGMFGKKRTEKQDLQPENGENGGLLPKQKLAAFCRRYH